MSKQLEEGLKLELDWNKLEKAVAGTKGIIPVAVQNADTQEVILVAYINQLAFEESLKRKMLVLWSSSRQELWIKGLTSGETFELLEARVNCEQNSPVHRPPESWRHLPHQKRRGRAARLLLSKNQSGNAGTRKP